LRAKAGIEAVSRDYHSSAVVGTFATDRPHRNVAFQWFRDDGVLALLPLPQNHVSMVWSTSEQYADRLMSLDAAELAQRAGSAADSLGGLRLLGKPASFPLRFMRARSTIGHRLVVLGDAAHNVHPLAGQGLNIGLGDCEALSEVMASRAPAQTVASPDLLARYRRRRAEELATMQFVTDGLQRLFEARTPGLKWLRNAGLRLVDRVFPVKHELVKRAARPRV
jgi:ubiquinone biosynthesis UbiH/UbiF/VisC/COQ6 family hydroxylase